MNEEGQEITNAQATSLPSPGRRSINRLIAAHVGGMVVFVIELPLCGGSVTCMSLLSMGIYIVGMS
jgi:hypothetical protein